ncbi:MAG: CerR family C-terminal domain-containing protein [Verrucomicrobiae bacterium]|nr:CerR family C-terminal domain-containing protein [Verrucomicrobiae bacterium]
MDPTQTKLIEAAGEVFARRGFRGATVREICGRAKANVAAINYHFGSKEALYAQVLRSWIRRAEEKYPIHEASKAGTPEEKLVAFVRAFLARVSDPDRPDWHTQVIAREMAEPSKEFRDLLEETVRPLQNGLGAIVAEILGAKPTDIRVRRSVYSILGQCVYYRSSRAFIHALNPELALTPARVSEIADHIAEFSIQALRGMRSSRRRA